MLSVVGGLVSGSGDGAVIGLLSDSAGWVTLGALLLLSSNPVSFTISAAET